MQHIILTAIFLVPFFLWDIKYIYLRKSRQSAKDKKGREKSRHYPIFVLMNHPEVVGHRHNKRTHIYGMTNSLPPGGIR